MTYCDKVLLQTANDKIIETIKLLNSKKDMDIRVRAKYKSQVKDFEGYIDSKISKEKSKWVKKLILSLTKVIDFVDKQIGKEFKNNQKFSKQKEILMSVGGVCEKVANETIMATKGFK